MLAIPILQRVDSLGLELRTITVKTVRGTTINGVSIDVTSCCQVKIQGWTPGSQASTSLSTPTGSGLQIDYPAIQLAAQHFIGKNNTEIETAIQKTIAGHQRSIIGTLTVEQLYRERVVFSEQVLNLCQDDMRNMGLTIVSYTVAEITDEGGYIEALGVNQTELVKKDATQGRAKHQGEARSEQARQEAGAHLVVNQQQERMIESDKLRKVTMADAQKEVDRRVAIQMKAKDIAAAEQDAILLVERQKAAAAEAHAELKVLEQKVAKAKLTKEREVHVEADARLYQATVNADSVRATAAAEADRIRTVGEAEADSIRARGKAEIDVLRARVMVWQECGNQAAILEKMIEILPQVASAVAAPLAKTEKMVFIGSGGGGGGPSQFTREMEKICAEVPETVQAITGYDIRSGIASLMSGKGDSIIQGISEGTSTAVADRMMMR